MKLHTISAALATVCLGITGLSVQAQGISDDVIRIGSITDMSGVYSDIDGKAGVDAIRMAIEDIGGTFNGKKNRTSDSRPPKQGRYCLGQSA